MKAIELVKREIQEIADNFDYQQQHHWKHLNS
jgi:hypothetical protein